MREQLKRFYLEWANDWLSIERMAEHHDIPQDDCLTLINAGRDYFYADHTGAADAQLKNPLRRSAHR